MKTFFIIALIILLSNLIFSNFVRAEDENDKVKISKITIEGLQSISTDKIKESMATEFPSFKPWVKKSAFDERTLKDDVLRIKDLLGNYGYYGAKVDYNLKFNNKKTAVEIFIKIDEGDPVILNELNIVIPKGHDGDIEKSIIQSIPIKVNEVFSVFNYEKSKTIINQLLADKGYPKPDVKGEATISRKDKVAKSTFTIDPGKKYLFGEIVIEGNSDIDINLIKREITYKEGSIFNLKDISDSQENIFKLSFFKSVIIDSEFDDENLKVKTIYTLSERKLRTVRVGVGAGTEDILRGQVSYNQRNFLGGARSLEIGTRVSFITQNLQTIIKQPYFFSKDNELRALVNVERNDLPSFEGESVNSELKFTRNIYSFLSAYASTNLIFAKIDSVADSTPIVSSQEDITLALFGGGIQYNTTDNFIDPTKGVFASFFLESSFDSFISDQSFIKSLFEFKTYKQINNFVFAKRLQIGFIQPFDSTDELEVPVFKRFFAGGSTSMRGFPFQRLGPLNDDEDPLGGNSIFVGNLETRFPLFKKIGGVLFFDYGNVFPSSFDYKFDDIRYAVGTGLRYNTIVGPVRLDVGYALNPVDEISRVQVFISIGQAF